MKHTLKKVSSLFCLVLLLSLIGCGKDSDTLTILTGPDEVVPAKTELVEKLEDAGYTITEYTSVEDCDLTLDRVVAEKGDKFIDIVYGLTDEDAETVFDVYYGIYGEEYYILARNGNYVYCASDKKTFSKAGFTSLSNIGEQYIND